MYSIMTTCLQTAEMKPWIKARLATVSTTFYDNVPHFQYVISCLVLMFMHFILSARTILCISHKFHDNTSTKMPHFNLQHYIGSDSPPITTEVKPLLHWATLSVKVDKLDVKSNTQPCSSSKCTNILNSIITQHSVSGSIWDPEIEK